MLQLTENAHTVIIENEPAIIFPDIFADSSRQYDITYSVGDAKFAPSSAHGVSYSGSGGHRSCLILARAGPTSVHSRSALLHSDRCLVAVGHSLVCLQLPELNMVWHTKVDLASCFGIYHAPKYESYISHGELDIARVSYNGEIVWSNSGKDIFTNGFILYDTYIEVVDFNNEMYRIDLITGHSQLL